MNKSYRSGEVLIYQNKKYQLVSVNPDKSLLVRPLGGQALINIPDKGVVRESQAKGVTIYSGKLLG